jgi:hypothetical protein
MKSLAIVPFILYALFAKAELSEALTIGKDVQAGRSNE